MPHVTFIHGIANKPPKENLLDNWLHALSAGGLDLDTEGVTSSLVYWADVVYESPLSPEEQFESVDTGLGTEALDEDESWIESLPANEQGFVEAFRKKLNYDAVSPEGDSYQTPEPVNEDQLEKLEFEAIPLPWFIKRRMMKILLKDVHHYLFNASYTPRQGETFQVQDEIRQRFVSQLEQDQAIANGPHIVVSHSMGTVISYDCLKNVDACPSVSALMTVGSPLGLSEIQDNYSPAYQKQNAYPAAKVIGDWVNVYDRLDPVVFAARLAKDYQRVMNKSLKELLDTLASAAGQFNTDEVGRVSGNIVQHIDENIATHPAGFVSALNKAVDAFDQETARLLCDKLVVHLRTRSKPYPFKQSKAILSMLRRKRYFGLITQVADMLIQTSQDHPNIQRQYAQALIDQGNLTAGLEVLVALKQECIATKNNAELAEAIGLIGRAHKQLYMDACVENKPGALMKEHLADSIDSYYEVYKKAKENTWHGVNTVALLARAKRDRISLDNRLPKPDAIGKKVLATVKSVKKPSMWDFATAAEACLATNDYEKAVEWIVKYTDPANKYADAFEYASTLRQFEEVWQLDDGNEEQVRILHLLRAALLKAEGGRVEIENPSQQLASIKDLQLDGQYEKILGKDRYKSFKWYLQGLERAAGVAQICDSSGNGIGTGFLLRGADVHEQFKDTPWLLMTNAHVISDNPAEQNATPGSLPPDEAVVRFEAAGTEATFELDGILFSSPRNELDCTILSFSSSTSKLDNITPFDIAKRMPLKQKNQRVYIIGHPKGGNLSFSIDDNLLLDHKEPKIHYRTPTEGGSSGSPVFNQNWKLIALHHAGGFNMKKLNGENGTYAANEGLWIKSILSAVDAELNHSV